MYFKKIKNLQICKFAEVLSLHKNLELKLNKMGIQGTALDWLKKLFIR